MIDLLSVKSLATGEEHHHVDHHRKIWPAISSPSQSLVLPLLFSLASCHHWNKCEISAGILKDVIIVCCCFNSDKNVSLYLDGTNHDDLGLSNAGNEGHYISRNILTGVTHHLHSSCQQEKDLEWLGSWQISQRTTDSSHTYKHTFLSFKNVQHISMDWAEL